jgi:uncharacterized membrane-anchored protein
MSARLTRLLLAASLLLVLVAATMVVRGYERTIGEGRIVLAELAPVDPRSLMQGDYMALRFAIDDQLAARTAGAEPERLPRYAWLRVDPEGRASLASLEDGLPPADDERVAVRIRGRGGQPSIGPNAFFFQEGTADRYEAARWGEFRVSPGGRALLTHLRDEELGLLGEIDR